jgi:hypothetical protein
MGGLLVPGHVVLKGALWTAAATASVLPAGLLGISTIPTAKLPLEDALVYGIRTALFAASFMYITYFITSQQIDREDPQGRFLMHRSRGLAAAMFCTTVQVRSALPAQASCRAATRCCSACAGGPGGGSRHLARHVGDAAASALTRSP